MTLQQQYNLIKEGKGDKNFFMKQALRQFPNFLNVNNTFEQTVSILQSKSIISEGIGGVISVGNETPNWFKIFEAEVKAEMKATDKEVVDMETKGYDYKDKKIIDNVYSQAFLLGYYVEMEDPKNAEKTVSQLKDMVAKNLAKDINFYVKDGQFGIKGVGYETSEETKEPTGKFKSSGYGNLKESKYSLVELLGEKEEMYEEDAIDEGAMDDQIAAAEKEVAQKKKEAADAEKKAADIKAKEADAEANA